jgi:hypothetical protein
VIFNARRICMPVLHSRNVTPHDAAVCCEHEFKLHMVRDNRLQHERATVEMCSLGAISCSGVEACTRRGRINELSSILLAQGDSLTFAENPRAQTAVGRRGNGRSPINHQSHSHRPCSGVARDSSGFSPDRPGSLENTRVGRFYISTDPQARESVRITLCQAGGVFCKDECCSRQLMRRALSADSDGCGFSS